jgi:hypothetical protein
MGISKEKGIIPFSKGDPTEMSDNAFRVISYHSHMEYVNYVVDSLKEYVGEPLKWERHTSRLFDAWKKRGEAIKESISLLKSKDGNQKPIVEKFIHQENLNKRFIEFILNKNDIEIQSFWYELVTGDEAPYSFEHRKYYEDDVLKTSPQPYFEEKISSLGGADELKELAKKWQMSYLQ